MTVKEKIIQDIGNTPIFLYMKGTKERPACGFSSKEVNVLNSHSVVSPDVNVLEDPKSGYDCQSIPTDLPIPQLFVNGALIGGCDIVMEMESNGKLKDMLAEAGT